MHMIRKLGEDKKAYWPSHLAEIVHTYNATHSAVTRYGPHYLMFGCRPRLLVDFFFPTIGSSKAPTREASTNHVDEYIASIWDRLRTALWEVQAQSMVEAHRQKQYYNRKIGAVNLKPGDLVIGKADAFKGKRKTKDRSEEGTWEAVCQITTDILSYKVTKQHGKSSVSTETNFFLLHHRLAFPCVWASIMHWTGVPAPPHARLPLQEVKQGLCHKRIMVRQSTIDLPAKLPWGGLMGSYDFCHGCPLEHPLKMGEDFR